MHAVDDQSRTSSVGASRFLGEMDMGGGVCRLLKNGCPHVGFLVPVWIYKCRGLSEERRCLFCRLYYSNRRVIFVGRQL